MSAYTGFRIVPDDLRKLATQGRWTDVITAISIGRTVLIPADDARAAANALSQAMRSRGFRLRRKSVDTPDTGKGTIFWADKKLGN